MNIADARTLFPALENTAYFNSSAVALGNTRLAEGLRALTEQWTGQGFDYVRAEAAADASRELVAQLLNTDARDIALVPSVSSAAGLVAAQFLTALPGQNLIVGAQEYSSNHFPWRQLAARGYAVRQVPFRNGGLEVEDIARLADQGTRLIAVSSIQTATGHRTDLCGVGRVARDVGAWLFVDGAQSVGAVSMDHEIGAVDFLATSDHKFLLNAGRGMGYLYIRREVQEQVLPLGAGWKAGKVPFESFFGPAMNLSGTASRFDASISWLAAIGDEICLRLMAEIGFDAIFRRNAELGDKLRAALAGRSIASAGIPQANQSHIVSVPLDGRDGAGVLSALREHGVVASVRDGQLRLSPHFYNDERDIDRCVEAIAEAFGRLPEKP